MTAMVQQRLAAKHVTEALTSPVIPGLRMIQ